MNPPLYGSADERATYNNMIRLGFVVDRRAGEFGPEVRVTYDDRGVTSAWLPIGKQGSANTGMHFVPRIGDTVTVLHYPTGIENGVVVCSHNTQNNPGYQPRSLNAIAMQADDGSYFEYDPDVGCLSINGISTLFLSSNGDIQVNTGGNLTASVGGSLSATVSGSATLKASQIKLDGPVEITGTLKVDGVTTLAAGGTATPRLSNSDGSGGGS
jgi:phage baseplate assembly protein V